MLEEVWLGPEGGGIGAGCDVPPNEAAEGDGKLADVGDEMDRPGGDGN